MSQARVIFRLPMPTSRQDFVQLAKEVEGLLREYDPAVLDLILRGTERPDEPRWYVVELLRKTKHVYTERSGGMHSKILDTINRFVRLEGGSPIRGLSVALSPAEQERYQIKEVSLAELPDRAEFLDELDRITLDLIHEIESSGRRQ